MADTAQKPVALLIGEIEHAKKEWEALRDEGVELRVSFLGVFGRCWVGNWVECRGVNNRR